MSALVCFRPSFGELASALTVVVLIDGSALATAPKAWTQCKEYVEWLVSGLTLAKVRIDFAFVFFFLTNGFFSLCQDVHVMYVGCDTIVRLNGVASVGGALNYASVESEGAQWNLEGALKRCYEK